MDFHEQNLGTPAVFLLPSLKLREPPHSGPSVEASLHAFLMENFGGYTAQAGNIFGYWRDEKGNDSYGEHREFTVALVDDSKMPVLKSFWRRWLKTFARNASIFEQVIRHYSSTLQIENPGCPRRDRTNTRPSLRTRCCRKNERFRSDGPDRLFPRRWRPPEEEIPAVERGFEDFELYAWAGWLHLRVVYRNERQPTTACELATKFGYPDASMRR